MAVAPGLTFDPSDLWMWLSATSIYHVRPLTLFRWTQQAITTPLKGVDSPVSPNGLPASGTTACSVSTIPNFLVDTVADWTFSIVDLSIFGLALRIRDDPFISIPCSPSRPSTSYVALTVVG
jgi:hypothetical protein